MRPSPTSRAGGTPLVLPVLLSKKCHIDPPNDDGLALFQRLGWVHKIAKNDVPACMVIVRLDRPRALAGLHFKGFVRTRTGRAPLALEVGKALLGRVYVPGLLVHA